jgi:hypothetical protein
MLWLVPLEATAGARGSGMHIGGHRVVRGHHFPLARQHFRPLARQRFRSVRNQAFGAWPWYGYYDMSPYTYDGSMSYQMPETLVVRPDPPQVRCQHSEQTRTVPSANGGTTEVTILRC